MMRDEGLELTIFLVLGALLCAAYLGALRWNVRLYCRGRGAPLALMIHVLRMLGTAAAFAAMARAGAAPLLCAAAGFHCVRIFALGAQRRSSEALP